MKDRILQILLSFNVTRAIADHLIGKDHSIKHRMGIGAVLMFLGVKLATLFEFPILHFLGEMIGYAIHGTGLIPFIDYLGSKNEEPVPEKGDGHGL